ncbi:MAG: DUF2617 family protein [Phycisphaerae bacterium]|nr:DUF2617 family protein [Phycisphaerae bacterium]NUQ47109.1 DUF2617 family protein [Phycisphaerae bacterium]
MAAETTQQRSADLSFFLYRRALHPELFHIYLDRHVELPRYQADIWITGLGHLVTLQINGTMVTELTSVANELLTDRNLITQFRYRGERDFQYRFEDDVRYIFSSQVEEMSEHIFRTTYRDLSRNARKRGLFVPYKHWAVGGLEPFSYVDYEARQREFHVDAFHVFPGEWRILRTQSIFELPHAGRHAKR